MRYFSIAFVACLGLFVAACGDDDDASGPGGAGSGGAAGEPSSSDGGEAPSGGGSMTTGNAEFTDLPGKVRFVNFVSDGTEGKNLDLYWGTSYMRGERVTLPYGQVTDFMTPRHLVSPAIDANAARFFIVLEGDVTATATSYLVNDDPKFDANTVLTIALAGNKAAGASDGYVVSEQIFYEHQLTTPPAGSAHVYGWSLPFDSIDKGDFVLVGADGLCSPDNGEPGGANLGFPALIPGGAAGLALFDANSDCATGSAPVTDTVTVGHSYVLLGKADTYALDAREAVLLEVGAEAP